MYQNWLNDRDISNEQAHCDPVKVIEVTGNGYAMDCSKKATEVR